VKLLIIDDSPEIRAALGEIAREYGHEVVGEAEHGKQGLTLVPEVHPEMVLLDVSMPVMGGFATARELRRIAPDIPVLFISQHAGADYVTEAFELGARGYLLKSALISQLNHAIETISNGQLYRSAQVGNGKPK
jgi:DNA-binding NarL/FixJ family response regulator